MVFLAIVLIGLLVRFYLLPTAGMALDLAQLYHWGVCATERGWLGMYNCTSPMTHPPLNPSFYGLEIWLLKVAGANISPFENNHLVISILKSHLVIAELVLIGLLYYVVRDQAGPIWAVAVAAALYWNPGWLVVTAWWGQNDVSYSLFMLLTAYLVTQRKIRWALIDYGIAWLAEFPS